ncbi:alpha/beta hydrolase [Paenibacillus oralis]|uniref:Alpha/beta hydrolase n=1 Tax=Paenibacillus oralis TaxID=2490856 RepID=A0A3P3U1R5_9BACL|nr:alpha/beta hydrolase [Paenibacillus oralis]RRJ64272.1 alpha/beta hydrolase [Paenibacillus oralis]
MELQILTELVLQKPALRFRLIRRIQGAYRYDTAYWRFAAAGPWGAGMFAFMLLALGMPTGLGAGFDMLLFVLTGTMGMFAAAHAAAVLLALIGVPVPRLFAGILLYDLIVIFFIFYFNEVPFAASAVISGVVTLAGTIAGIIAAWVARLRLPLRTKAGLIALLALFGLTAAVWPDVSQQTGSVPASLSDSGVFEPADNPGNPGTYQIFTLYYGSGKDRWQPEFGKETDLRSESVDASAYIKSWTRLRTWFWGYDQHALPVNGRVWMPDAGEGSSGDAGPYPLVLIVHGNHLMEDFSEGGYAYLGELLASRGYVAVSVDENFLNYSAWSGIPDNDMKVRAWMLLKHLQQIGKFAAEPGNPFYGKIDFGQIALIGHSRGGQAVAMAADYRNWFGSDASLQNLDSFRIQAAVAIAPTDKKVDNKYTRLRDVSYLTLQGARDGDVNDFDGDRQYLRTTYSRSSDKFKASIYIADANHSQFNSSWGASDVSYPKGILLSRSGMMAPDEQREIAKVYISAFLEEALQRQKQDQGSYLALFQDYRTGMSWLPDTDYYNRFESGSFIAWARYDEDTSKTSIPGGGKAEASGLIWLEQNAKNRHNVSKPTRGIVLERSESMVSGGISSVYTLQWEQGAPLSGSGESAPEWLSFSLADLSHELELNDSAAAASEISVELTDGHGIAARLPLSAFMDRAPLPETTFTIHPWLERNLSEGKYKHPTEAVFQTYRLPLSAFAAAKPGFDPPAGITRLAFRLDGGPAKIMLDNIGVY